MEREVINWYETCTGATISCSFSRAISMVTVPGATTGWGVTLTFNNFISWAPPWQFSHESSAQVLVCSKKPLWWHHSSINRLTTKNRKTLRTPVISILSEKKLLKRFRAKLSTLIQIHETGFRERPSIHRQKKNMSMLFVPPSSTDQQEWQSKNK